MILNNMYLLFSFDNFFFGEGGGVVCMEKEMHKYTLRSPHEKKVPAFREFF